jgi:hypothetical protein
MLSCLARNGPKAQGKKVDPTSLRLRRSRRSRSSARSSQGEARRSRALKQQPQGEDLAGIGRLAQGVEVFERRERGWGAEKGDLGARRERGSIERRSRASIVRTRGEAEMIKSVRSRDARSLVERTSGRHRSLLRLKTMDRPTSPTFRSVRHPLLSRPTAPCPDLGRWGHRRHTNKHRPTDEHRSDNSERFPPARRGHADLGKGQSCVEARNGGGRRE